MTRTDGERGSLTLWMLGLVVVVLFLGGLSLDLWRAFNERRALAGLVEAAAIAGASGLDEEAMRRGTLQLDPVRAEELAWANLLAAGESTAEAADVTASATEVTVTAAGTVELTLLGILLPDTTPIDVSARAVSSPRGGA